MSIREGDDQRVLLKCWTGCSAAEVVAALGLNLGDLFERPVAHHHAPLSRREQARALQISAADALALLGAEGLLIVAAGRRLLSGELTEIDQARAVQAVARVLQACQTAGLSA